MSTVLKVVTEHTFYSQNKENFISPLQQCSSKTKLTTRSPIVSAFKEEIQALFGSNLENTAKTQIAQSPDIHEHSSQVIYI